jgi:NTE family protein
VISFMTELIDEGKVSDGKRMFIHSIEAEDIIKNLAASSKMNADWTFLTHLFGRGREYADAWLTENFDSIGVETTVDLKADYF